MRTSWNDERTTTRRGGDRPACRLAAVLLLAAAPLAGAAAEAAAPPATEPLATSEHFAFYSDLATNLNDALIVAGAAREAGTPELFAGGEEAGCFAALAPSARAGWNRAVDYYAEVVSPPGWKSRQQFLLRVDLAGLAGPTDARVEQYLSITRGFMAAAKPAYEACRWEAQDAENRRWVEALVPRIEAHGAALSARVERAFAATWHGLPLRVDVVGTAPPVGANTIYLTPEGGHIQVSSDFERSDALETIYHEAAHTLMRPGDPLPRALAAAAAEVGIEEPPDLWHVLLFYNLGDAARRTLAEAGVEDYVPYLDAKPHLWGGPWGRYRSAVETHWPPYLAGETSLEEAMLALLRAIAEAPPEAG